MRCHLATRAQYLFIAVAFAACSGDEPSAADRALKERLVGSWYWSYEWLSRDATVHTLIHRKSDGTWVRYTRVHNRNGTIETGEQSGTWDINGARYAERTLVLDGEHLGTGARKSWFVIKSLVDNAVELEGENINGRERVERKVTANFALP